MNDIRDKIIQSISIEKSRVYLEPFIVFLCGGEVDVEKTTNHSARNVFMNIAGQIDDRNIDFILAENWKDWKEGYKSLSEFENDIAYLSSKVIIIPETPGSLAELGLFYGNEIIRKKLTVILNREHHDSLSFIKYGILDQLEKERQDTVLPYNINYDDIENQDVKNEINDALDVIIRSCQQDDKTKSFSLKDRGHILFFIFQIIDLFYALTITEILKYICVFEDSYDKPKVTSALYILQKFDLIQKQKRGDSYYYFSKPNSSLRIDIKHKDDSVNFDYSAKKIEVLGFYNSSSQKQRMKFIDLIRKDK
jgi:hypothetical protein